MLVRNASLTDVILMSIQNLCFIEKEKEEEYVALFVLYKSWVQVGVNIIGTSLH